ncbi:MAG: HAMP domain-containing histidine kinase [Anaerolineaceae bacterium]|nr:HAMP domain-containing histidine kinase [Anaerolineaceae bacterium]
MIHKNGVSPRILSLNTSTAPDWFQQAVAHLSQIYHVTNSVFQPDAAYPLSDVETHDVIVAPVTCSQSIRTLADMLRQVQPSHMPLFIMLTDSPTENDILDGADVILPVQPYNYLDWQLNTILKLHNQNKALRQQNQQIQAQNTQLSIDLVRSQRVVSEINLLKEAIVSTVSHELKTPLLQVKSSVALLAENAGNTELLIEYAQVAVTRLEAVINNIARLTESLNMDSQHLGPVLVRESIDYAIRNLRRSWEHKDDTERIVVDLKGTLPPVHAYKQGLTIALQMLLDNALKFSSDKVIVTARPVENGVSFSIADRGIGIPNNKIEKIFDSFYQIDSASTRQRGGIGVGLAIVRFIMERHNTRIEVQTAEGKGSTFSFILPVAELRRK